MPHKEPFTELITSRSSFKEIFAKNKFRFLGGALVAVGMLGSWGLGGN